MAIARLRSWRKPRAKVRISIELATIAQATVIGNDEPTARKRWLIATCIGVRQALLTIVLGYAQIR